MLSFEKFFFIKENNMYAYWILLILTLYLQLYEGVIDKKYGDIHQIWITPGHIFISVKEGRQLFTFDNKSTSSAIVSI
jgi:hypothetical protein